MSGGTQLSSVLRKKPRMPPKKNTFHFGRLVFCKSVTSSLLDTVGKHPVQFLLVDALSEEDDNYEGLVPASACSVAVEIPRQRFQAMAECSKPSHLLNISGYRHIKHEQ